MQQRPGCGSRCRAASTFKQFCIESERFGCVTHSGHPQLLPVSAAPRTAGRRHGRARELCVHAGEPPLKAGGARPRALGPDRRHGSHATGGIAIARTILLVSHPGSGNHSPARQEAGQERGAGQQLHARVAETLKSPSAGMLTYKHVTVCLSFSTNFIKHRLRVASITTTPLPINAFSVHASCRRGIRRAQQ